MSKIEDRAAEISQPVVERLGYEFVDCEYTKEGAQWLLIVYMDKPGGVDLDDCESVSRELDPLFDAEDFIESSYCLCVSSPGLDRPLRKPRDFERETGKTVDVKLYKPRDGSKEYTGVLTGFSGESVTINDGNSEILFALKETAKISLHIDF